MLIGNRRNHNECVTNKINLANLLTVLHHPTSLGSPIIPIKLALLNIRSLANKSLLVNDIISSYNLDFMFLTETWLTEDSSATILNETAPEKFGYLTTCRSGRKGGGVAALFKDIYISAKKIT